MNNKARLNNKARSKAKGSRSKSSSGRSARGSTPRYFQLHIMIPEELHLILAEASRREDRSKSSIVRRWLESAAAEFVE